MVVPHVFYEDDHGGGASADPAAPFALSDVGPGPQHPPRQLVPPPPTPPGGRILGGMPTPAMATMPQLPHNLPFLQHYSHGAEPTGAAAATAAHPGSRMMAMATMMRQDADGGGLSLPPHVPPPGLQMMKGPQAAAMAMPLPPPLPLPRNSPMMNPRGGGAGSGFAPSMGFLPGMAHQVPPMPQAPLLQQQQPQLHQPFPFQETHQSHPPSHQLMANPNAYASPMMMRAYSQQLQLQQHQQQQYPPPAVLAQAGGPLHLLGSAANDDPASSSVSVQRLFPAGMARDAEPAINDPVEPESREGKRQVGSDVGAATALVPTTTEGATDGGGIGKAFDTADNATTTTSNINTNILSSAVPADARGYSFGSEIQELYGDDRSHPMGMASSAPGPDAAAAGALMRGEAAALGTFATTTSAPEAAMPSIPGASTGMRLGGAGAGPYAAPAAEIGDVGAGYSDGNSDAPPFAFSDQHARLPGFMPSGMVGVPHFNAPLPFLMGQPHPNSMHQQPATSATSNDPYVAMMTQQSLQQQQVAPIMTMMQQHQQHQQQHFGYNDVLAQQQQYLQHQQHAMLTQLTALKEQVLKRRRRSSDSISSDDDLSGEGEVAPPRASWAPNHMLSQKASTVHRLEGGDSDLALAAPDRGAHIPEHRPAGFSPQLQHQPLVSSNLNQRFQPTSSAPLGMPTGMMGHSHQHSLQQQLLLQQQHLQAHQQMVYGGLNTMDGMGGGIPMHLQQQLYPSAPTFAMMGGVGGGYGQVVSQLQASSVGSTFDAEEGLVDRKEKKRRTKSFPEKLLSSIMEHASDESAVAWLSDGKSFVVVNTDSFVQQILNPAFKECKYSSFVRKLHRWGFVRMTSGTGTDCFHHPLFQRGRLDLVSKLACTPRERDGTIKGVGRGWKPPSLAGVERFVRAKTEVAAASKTVKARVSSLLLKKKEEIGEASSNLLSGAVATPSVTPSKIEADDDDDTEGINPPPSVY